MVSRVREDRCKKHDEAISEFQKDKIKRSASERVDKSPPGEA
jgi:hypothetical protein